MLTRGVPIQRCPSGLAGGRSPRSTSSTVLAAYDAAEPGEKGAILRRKGLYSSHIVEWRRARDAGALAGLTAPRGQRRPDTRDATIARLTKEKTRLERELARTRFVVDVQARLQALLEKLSESEDAEPRSTP